MDRIQLRRDSSARWAEVNPILLEGEVGFETDTKLRKIGDGVHRWNELEYLRAENVVQELGYSECAVVSQKVVSEKLTELKSGLDEIFGKEETSITDISSYPSEKGTVDSSGNWKFVTNYNYRHKVIPIIQGSSLSIKASESNTGVLYVSFLSTYSTPTADGEQVNIADGYSTRYTVSPGINREFGQLSDNVRYIILEVVQNGITMGIDSFNLIYPSIKGELNEIKENLDKALNECNSIQNKLISTVSLYIQGTQRNNNYAISENGKGVKEASGYYIYRYDISDKIGENLRLSLNSFGNYTKAAFYRGNIISQDFISFADDNSVIPEGCVYLMVTTQNIEEDEVFIEQKLDRLKAIEDKIDSTNEENESGKLPSGIIGMFGKWSVIGTSFDCGIMYSRDGSPHGNEWMGWEHQLTRRYGNTHERLAFGGARANLWLGVGDNKTEYIPTSSTVLQYGLGRLKVIGSELQLVMITIGCNDANYNSEGKNQTGISLGSASDIVMSLPDDIERGKTFVYYYSCIICAVKKYAPNAKIILCHSFLKTATRNEAYNAMIDTIAESFSLPLIKQEEDVYFKAPYHDEAMVLTHPIGANYSGIATAYDRLISKCVYENTAYFEDYFGGGEESEPVL